MSDWVIGAAAETTGAIRQVLDVEAVHMGPDAVRATVCLSFKEGVSASHVAPILDKLAAAVHVAQPNVSVVLAAGNSSKSDQKA